MDLVLKLNDHLKETEKKLDTLIQLKQEDVATSSTNVIPTVSIAVPSTLAASLAPTIPLATTLPATTEYTPATGTSGEKVAELVKAMEEMTIQATKMKNINENVAKLEINCKLAQLKQKEETQKAQRMGERNKILEKDLTMEKPLGQTKEMLRANIIDSVNHIWPSIQVIFEQIELVRVAIEAIQKEKKELGNKSEDANRLIHFLNSKNRYEL